MATFHLTWTTANLTGSTGIKVKYRIKGTSVWSSFIVVSSGNTETATFQADNNRIYDVQYQNINNADNPLSSIVNGIGFSDPDPTLSPTNTTLGYSFANLSEDIDSYTVAIALYSSPGTIIETQTKTPADTITGQFTGLDALTEYYLYITPVADQFSDTFTYTFVTDATSSCASVQNATAVLSDRVVTITWDNPTPHSECGYKAFYRRNTDSEYTEIDTSGSTSGTTHVTATLVAPACIEGYTVSDCCEGSLSDPDPFGINAYVPFSVDITVVNNISAPTGFAYQIALTSQYSDSYNTVIDGVFHTTAGIGSIVPFEITYPSGSTSYTTELANAYPDAIDNVISQIDVNAVSPIFDSNGQLQRYDSVSTPPYFKQYWEDNTSGTTWDGSPTSLPSFILTAFNITEQDQLGNTLQGNLLMSWIYDSVYQDGVSPYDIVTLEVYDPGSNLLGSVSFGTATIGLRATSIVLDRVSINYPLTAGTQFTMTAKWNDESTIVEKTFYLPI